MNQGLIERAKALGADDARLISTDVIVVEPQLIELCKSPGCEGYGKSANCPPHVMSPKEAIFLINNYHQALVFKTHHSPEALLGEKHHREFRKIFLICSALERKIARLGDYSPFGLGAGSCKPVFCEKSPCAVLEGGECPHPELARPSMEALGVNVFKLAEEVGWEIHRMVRNSDPGKIPSAMLMGMVLF